MLMQTNSDMTRTQNLILQAYVRVHLTNVLFDNGSLKRTIYCYIWGIIFTCFTYYRVLVFVCLRISRYRVRFIQTSKWAWQNN